MLQIDNFVDIKENESAFQKALKENNTEGMWKSVYIACYNICKSIYSKRGFIANDDDLYDTSINSTMMVMRNILERGVKPEKLSSYCYLRCLCHCNGYGTDKFSRKLEETISNMDICDYINEELYE